MKVSKTNPVHEFPFPLAQPFVCPPPPQDIKLNRSDLAAYLLVNETDGDYLVKLSHELWTQRIPYPVVRHTKLAFDFHQEIYVLVELTAKHSGIRETGVLKFNQNDGSQLWSAPRTFRPHPQVRCVTIERILFDEWSRLLLIGTWYTKGGACRFVGRMNDDGSAAWAIPQLTLPECVLTVDGHLVIVSYFQDGNNALYRVDPETGEWNHEPVTIHHQVKQIVSDACGRVYLVGILADPDNPPDQTSYLFVEQYDADSLNQNWSLSVPLNRFKSLQSLNISAKYQPLSNENSLLNIILTDEKYLDLYKISPQGDLVY